MNRLVTRKDSASLFMMQPREPAWWFWLASAALLVAWVAGRPEAFWLLLGLSLFQVAYFGLQESRLRAFPAQVRIAYVGVIAAAAVDPTHLFVWVPTIGTIAQVVFGYCLLARAVSLLPWNGTEPFSAARVWRTFVSPPRRGSILQGQPALRAQAAP